MLAKSKEWNSEIKYLFPGDSKSVYKHAKSLQVCTVITASCVSVSATRLSTSEAVELIKVGRGEINMMSYGSGVKDRGIHVQHVEARQRLTHETAADTGGRRESNQG